MCGTMKLEPNGARSNPNPRMKPKLDGIIEIESRVTWPGGGTSLYFRDPEGHLLELLTPGVWQIY